MQQRTAHGLREKFRLLLCFSSLASNAQRPKRALLLFCPMCCGPGVVTNGGALQYRAAFGLAESSRTVASTSTPTLMYSSWKEQSVKVRRSSGGNHTLVQDTGRLVTCLTLV